jgi:hypothetical protein
MKSEGRERGNKEVQIEGGGKKMNKTILMSLVVLAVSVAFVSAGVAQQKPASAQMAPAQTASMKTAPAKVAWEKFSGLIEKADGAKKEVWVKGQKETMAFSVGERTKISEVATPLSFSDLKKGVSVRVEYKKEGNKRLAEWIDVTHKVEAKKEASASMEAKKMNPSERASGIK